MLCSLILTFKTKNYTVLEKPHQSIQRKPHWFDSDFILKVNQLIKPKRMFFYLTVRMTFNLKTEPNYITNTLN